MRVMVMNKKIVSFQLNDEEVEKIKYFYAGYEIEVNSPYVLVGFRIPGCSILIYNSHKIVFQGENAATEAKVWKPISPSHYLFNQSHAGSDETGTGDFFGPIIVVACYVKKADMPFLLELGVGDSKLIDDEKIRKIAPILLKRVDYSQLCLDNEAYNRLVDQKFNMNKIKAYLHNKALLHLKKKVEDAIPYFVIDQFTPEELYYRYLEDTRPIEKNIRFVTKAESASIAVACASIIARYSFIKRMDLLSKKVGTTLPKGAGLLVDKAGRNLFLERGPDIFKSIAKLNFKNYKRIKQLV